MCNILFMKMWHKKMCKKYPKYPNKMLHKKMCQKYPKYTNKILKKKHKKTCKNGKNI